MRATDQPLPTSGLVFPELEVGVDGEELARRVAARSKRVATSQGRNGHENEVAELRKQCQALGKVLLMTLFVCFS